MLLWLDIIEREERKRDLAQVNDNKETHGRSEKDLRV